MRKRIFILILVLALALSGCQLAKPEADTHKEKDMLVELLKKVKEFEGM